MPRTLLTPYHCTMTNRFKGVLRGSAVGGEVCSMSKAACLGDTEGLNTHLPCSHFEASIDHGLEALHEPVCA